MSIANIPGFRGACTGSRRYNGRLFLLAAMLAAFTSPVAAVGPNNALNDTGVTTYGDASSNSLTSEPANFPGQDVRLGRDAAAAAGQLTKTGAGSKGFDFTKIGNGGAVLTASAALGPGASEWGCTFDNVTGLMWEVKVSDASHLRHKDWIYSWYNSNGTVNGGSPGTASGGTCRTAGRCDTEKFVQDVNAAGLCGHNDWRLPTRTELASIADRGRVDPTIDRDWFPNTYSADFWSASATATNASLAWVINFSYGYASHDSKVYGQLVRLVRDGP